MVGVQLPEQNEEATHARVRARFPETREKIASPTIHAAIEGMSALLRGEPADLGMITLDMTTVSAFCRRVYEATRLIRPGTTRSYGEIARLIGAPDGSRAVGQALGRNPFAIVVPCHRVVASGGKTGGFSAHGGISMKKRLLAIERGQATLWNARPLPIQLEGRTRAEPERCVDPQG